MEKAVLYARVSSKEQEAEEYSIPAQLKFLHEYASKHTHIVAQEFVDVETAKKSGRPEFVRMLDCVSDDPTVKHILVKKRTACSVTFLIITSLINSSIRSGISPFTW